MALPVRFLARFAAVHHDLAKSAVLLVAVNRNSGGTGFAAHAVRFFTTVTRVESVTDVGREGRERERLNVRNDRRVLHSSQPLGEHVRLHVL
jgi:hypothetical protein